MKLRLIIFSYMILASCSTGMKVPMSQIQRIDFDFAGSFKNKSLIVADQKELITLTDIFEIGELEAESIDLKIINSTSVELSSKVNGLLKSWTFHGNLSEQGYFEVYLRNNYDKGLKSFADIKRIRFSKSTNGNLLVDDYVRNERQFLLWRVGGRKRIQSEFESISNSEQ